MNSEIETDDWKLKVFFDWVPKWTSQHCKRCGGRGSVGGGFKSISGSEPCPDCHGNRTVSVPPATRPPEIPAALREHMRRAFWDYENKVTPTLVGCGTCGGYCNHPDEHYPTSLHQKPQET